MIPDTVLHQTSLHPPPPKLHLGPPLLFFCPLNEIESLLVINDHLAEMKLPKKCIFGDNLIFSILNNEYIN